MKPTARKTITGPRRELIADAAEPSRPWWATRDEIRDPATVDPFTGDPCAAWVKFSSVPIHGVDAQVHLERFVPLDSDLDVLTDQVIDSVVIDYDDQRIDFPVSLAPDFAAMIRAAVEVHDAPLKPLTVTRDDDEEEDLDDGPVLNADGTLPLQRAALDDEVEDVFFESMAEARQWVGAALGSEVGPDEYDVDEIARQVFTFDSAMDPETFTVHLDRQGFRLTTTTEQFWEIVRDNEIGPQERRARKLREHAAEFIRDVYEGQ